MGKTVMDIIIDFADSSDNKNIFQVLDDCVESAQNLSYATINVNWFVELKLKIEEEFKLCAKEHFVSYKWLMNNHRVEKTDSGLKITNLSRDFTILEIYFPSEFNPNSLIIKRNFY